ncbi:uncharacterized protein LOC133653996 isoform X1 [Entelurus aequoreus]|uniref:uncharacterized protein LOC133653996 isoform X1 n=1 Tax=Entelurus aequoreus TaxID=161455 RepID=UPI002B1E5B98|nr:uncharacterized protein LOC133653996 isoform X1 [Entelurus aequoreus]
MKETHGSSIGQQVHKDTPHKLQCLVLFDGTEDSRGLDSHHLTCHPKAVSCCMFISYGYFTVASAYRRVPPTHSGFSFSISLYFFFYSTLMTSPLFLSQLLGVPLEIMEPNTAEKDTTYTKIFVGGLPYHTDDASLRKYFQTFGDIDEAVVITDKHTGKSRGYGFVTMVDRSAAQQACKDANPIIDGRKANVNLAYLGAKPRSSQTSLSAGVQQVHPAWAQRHYGDMVKTLNPKYIPPSRDYLSNTLIPAWYKKNRNRESEPRIGIENRQESESKQRIGIRIVRIQTIPNPNHDVARLQNPSNRGIQNCDLTLWHWLMQVSNFVTAFISEKR